MKWHKPSHTKTRFFLEVTLNENNFMFFLQSVKLTKNYLDFIHEKRVEYLVKPILNKRAIVFSRSPGWVTYTILELSESKKSSMNRIKELIQTDFEPNLLFIKERISGQITVN